MRGVIPPELQKIEMAIASARGVSIDAIYDHNRIHENVHARHMIWSLASFYLGYSYSRLGRIYDRDHTTIRHGIGGVEEADFSEGRKQLEAMFPGLFKVGKNLLISQGKKRG